MTTATKHLADTVTRLTTTLTRLDADTIDRILTRLNDAKRGYPGGSDSIGAGRSDRTATLATTPTRDRAAVDLADLTRSVDLAWQLIITLDRIHANYGTLSIDRSCVGCRGQPGFHSSRLRRRPSGLRTGRCSGSPSGR